MRELISLSKKLYNRPPKNREYYIIAIDGRAGGGKTTLSNYLETLMPDFTFICGDDYFEPIEHPIAWGGYNEERFFTDVISPLSQGKRTIDHRAYDWDHEPHLKDHELKISKGVFIDRVYSFSFDLDYDLKIWVNTPREITLERGIKRSTMPKERAEEVWQKLWKPMEDKYILDINPEHSADIVVDGTLDFDKQIVA